MKNKIIFVSVLSLLFVVGCSGKVGLSGKVVYSDDKSPVPLGTVCIETETYQARGNIKQDGTFVISSFRENDGLPPGSYRVYIAGAQKIIGQDRDGINIYEPLISPEFCSISTTNITIDIKSTTKDFEIVVDRYRPTKAKK